MLELDSLWKKGKDFLGTRYPVIVGAMTWISTANFVANIANEGAFGCLAAGNLDPAFFKEEILKIQSQTQNPFGVNLITIAPNYRQHLQLAVELQVPYIIFAGSYPRGPEIKLAKESGARVLSFASTESLARRLIDMGIDALILEGSEAGGHVGHVSLIVLLQQVLFQVQDVPIFVAGGIASGRLIPYFLLMGAAGVQMGTYFVMTEECEAHPRFKEAFIRARARDAVATPQVGSELRVVSVRALRNKGLDKFAELQIELIQKRRRREISHEEAQYQVENFWVGALRRAVQEGDVEFGSLMAGQSVGLVDKVRPLREALASLVGEAEEEWQRLKNLCKNYL
jgi:enoyl-[acyl-carrier protein] reductase II